MTSSYKNYLNTEKHLTVEACQKLQEEILKEIGTDEEALDLYSELIRKAIEYACIRAKWTLMNKEEKADADESRTIKHDSLIVKFNQLAKYLKMQGKETAWRDSLGYEKDDKINRKRIGDMGCYLTFIHGINAR